MKLSSVVQRACLCLLPLSAAVAEVTVSRRANQDELAGDAAEQFASEPSWWSFRSPKTPPIPSVQNTQWVRNPLDAFVLRQLEEKDLMPASPADRMTWLRRAKFDLHGLPPTEQEIRNFLTDTAPGALERLLERLLASPHYGEAWGRHWLDVARYADSSGMDEDLHLPDAWRYRDYVMESMNLDIPYDRFVQEQIAGDLLPAEKPGTPNLRGILGTGFLALGPRSTVRQDKTLMVYEVVEEQIDTLSNAFLGLSIACARCHDHKFDPISTEDYYSLAAIFASTRSFDEIIPAGMRPPWVSTFYLEPLVPQEDFARYKEYEDRLKVKEMQIDATIEVDLLRRARGLYPRLIDYMLAARQVYEGGNELALVSARAKLDEKVLDKLVRHLDPQREFRLYLQKWHETDTSQWRTVAEEYQQLFLTTAQTWHEKIETWQAQIETAIEQRKTPPKKPLISDDLITVEARFFFDVHHIVFGVSEAKRETVLSETSKQRLVTLRGELEKLKKAAPAKPPLALAVTEGENVEQKVFLRGDYRHPGKLVRKRFPVVLAGPHQPPIVEGSGRRQLAEWLTQPSHPLTGRVMVNRIWQWHFGNGLVRTPNSFGTTGEKPTHPELLDYLATEFVSRGWSLKRMHRLIMSSSTYQMSSRLSTEAKNVDADNRMWSRFSSRRLSVEEARDSFLALDRSLDLTMGGPLGPTDMSYAAPGHQQAFHPDKTRRRAVYVPVIRNKLPSMMRLFDFVDSLTSCPKRTDSNTSLQALYMLNSENVRERSHGFARFLLSNNDDDDRGRVKRAYRISLTREPTPEELKQSLDYIENYPQEDPSSPDREVNAWQSFCRILMTSNEFNFVN